MSSHLLSCQDVSDLDSSIGPLLLTDDDNERDCLLLAVLELVQQLRVLLVQQLCLCSKVWDNSTSDQWITTETIKCTVFFF